MYLEFRNVSKEYKNEEALKRLSITFEPGVYGVLGANGAGKSTLMNLLTDNLARSSGDILYNGTDIRQLGKQFRKIIGYMPQQQGFYEELSARAFLYYMASVKGVPRKEIKEQVNNLLEVVNLSAVADRKISGFSGGMKQRILLAQALLGNPETLVLDEPTAGLDPKERINIRNFIAEISANKIILYATHVVSDIECIADKVLIMKDGEVLQFGTPAELMEKMEGHIFQTVCDKEQIKILSGQYKNGIVLQRKQDFLFRIAGDIMPDGFCGVSENINLEDVYLYYLGK